MGIEPIRTPEIKYTKLFINNEFVEAVNGKKYTVINPSTEEKLVDVEAADHADVEKAVRAAKAAFHRRSAWRTRDHRARGELLNKLASLAEENFTYLASLEALNVGKPFANAVYELRLSIHVIRYYAGWCDKTPGKTLPTNGPFFAFTRMEPVGICGQIIPWNVPLLMFIQKVAPCVAAGCVTVLKPSEMTPLTALFMCSLIKEAGFPPGVVNVVPGIGTEAGETIVKHPAMRKIAFTGSTRVGKNIGGSSAGLVKHIDLELGGKSPLVVCEDVDIDEAVSVSINACFMNNGQACINGTRTYVHESIYDEFVKKAAAQVSQRVVGDVFDPKTVQGPQINKAQMDKILGLIQKGIEEGAKLECGGKRLGSKGYFVEPTLFSNVTDAMTVSIEEIFGPVMCILKWSDFEDVIERSNNSCYGLAAGILTKDLNKAMIFTQSVESGNVWVNVYPYFAPGIPFGGVKDSGMGREYGEESVLSYLEPKSVVVKLPYKHS